MHVPVVQIKVIWPSPICTDSLRLYACPWAVIRVITAHSVCEAFVNLPKKSLNPALHRQDLRLLPLQTLALHQEKFSSDTSDVCHCLPGFSHPHHYHNLTT